MVGEGMFVLITCTYIPNELNIDLCMMTVVLETSLPDVYYECSDMILAYDVLYTVSKVICQHGNIIP